MPLFSIIIPVYNVERYLRKCLDSILNQDFTDYECILVNDGSTDTSKMICEEYCEKCDRFYLINQRNQGLSCARNAGINSAIGEYIVFLDSDDFIKDSALKNLHIRIANCGLKPDVIISTTYAYYEITNKCRERIWNPVKNELLPREALEATFKSKNFIIAAWTLTVKRNYLIQNALFFEPDLLHEDELWCPLAIMRAEKILVNKSPFYYNRCNRKDSIANSTKIKRCFDKLYIIEELARIEIKNDCQGMVNFRCAQLMIGVIKDYINYAEEDKDRKLYYKIKEKLYLICQSNDVQYRLFYIFCKIIGIRNASKILNRWDK